MSFSDDITNVLEGELSKRVVFPDLGIDARGIFDRWTAEFNQAEGVAVTAPKSSISMSYARLADVYSQIKGAVVRVYDPEGTDAPAYATYRAMAPRKYEDMTVEIGLERPQP